MFNQLWERLTHNQECQQLRHQLQTLQLHQQYQQDKIQQLDDELVGCRLKIQSDSIFIEEANERIERLTIQVSKKPEERDYTIEMPKLDIEEIKKALKLADEYTMETIIKYLKIDNYELIKNLAKTINKTNF